MDKAGLILRSFTVIMYFFPAVLLIFFIWLFSVTINNGNFAKAFDPFADFVFNYWYAMIFVVAVGLAAAIVFLASGIYVSIVYRKKIKEI